MTIQSGRPSRLSHEGQDGQRHARRTTIRPLESARVALILEVEYRRAQRALRRRFDQD